jgi:hypothetical protein
VGVLAVEAFLETVNPFHVRFLSGFKEDGRCYMVFQLNRPS